MTIEAATFSDFIFPASVTVCPFDAASLDTILIDRDAENARVVYHCGTERNVGTDGILRIGQSIQCAMNQLHTLRDLDEPGLRKELQAANQEKGVLAEQLGEAQTKIEQLEAEIAALEGGVTANQAAGFKVEFGTPVDKG